jgi:hypothetical protein
LGAPVLTGKGQAVPRVSEEKSEQAGGGKGGGGGGRPRVVPLPVKREVSEKHLANLRASGLTDETITLAELYTESHHTLLADLVQRRAWARQWGAALVIPFYLPGGSQPIGYRVRPSNPRVENRGKKQRAVKYDQAEAHGVLVYFTPRARAAGWYGDTGQPVYFCEGEKKALVFDQLGLCCVGLTGVWNWGDTKHKDATGEERLHPAIREHVTVAGRRCVVCFDSDARQNDNVMLAAARLAGMLLRSGAARVLFVCPPTAEQKGIDDFYAAFGEAVTRQLLESAVDIEPVDPKEPLQKLSKIKSLKEAPIGEDLRLPSDYDVHRDGTLWKLGDDKHGDAKVARGPMLIQRYLDDYYTHEGRLDLCFERDGRWVSVCVGRKAIADSRTMVAELSIYGAPVTSNNAARLVDWVEDLERVNAGRIDRVACVSRAGWHTIDGERVFVLDTPLSQIESMTERLALDTRGDRRKMFGALKPRGDHDKHVAVLRRAWEADAVAAAMICGALAAPLLEPLGAPNFAIHTPGESSKGKTSMLKIAASVYGDPQSEHWVASWNTTAVGAELRAAVLTDLPQCYDEVGSTDQQLLERMVYMLINGGGKSRGQRDLQLRETPSWRTVVLSTGERALADDSAATGAQVRVIQLPVNRFGKLHAPEIDELREGCIANAGSLGRAWIEALLGVDDWAPYREAVRAFTKKLRGYASGDPLLGRVAAYFAVLCVAEGMSALLGLGHEEGSTMHQLFLDQGKRERVRGVAERGIDLVRDWVLSESDTFPEIEIGVSGLPEPRSRNGSRALNGFRKDGVLLLIPKQFREFCDKHRLSMREVVREWAERGWLQHDNGRHDKSVRIGSQTPRFYAVEMAPAPDVVPENREPLATWQQTGNGIHE